MTAAKGGQIDGDVLLDRVALGKLMKQKRDRMFLSQKEAAKRARINYHSFVRAELGVMGNKVRERVVRWLETSDKQNGAKHR